MRGDWGLLVGDGDADAIIRERKEEKLALNIGTLLNFAVLVACGLWYALSASPTALALEIIAAAWLVGRAIQRTVFETHTMVMIAEARVRLIEQQLTQISFELPTR